MLCRHSKSQLDLVLVISNICGCEVLPVLRVRTVWGGCVERRCLRSVGLKGRHTIRPIDPDEYDAVMQNQPWACPLALLGDRRSGAEQLAGAAADVTQTVASLAATPSGRAMLDQLAVHVEKILAEGWVDA